ncbi:Triosephosphate isomerase [uncultured delta proteobacterium]|uniref:Triosephosphate isomerase n=1 Tax=uncultured delta proteobacterium TaxID=34034 RepID=A0A212J4A6_9DELT|nr:Triosephosphate isomerase [uncultured delta proteobacterium]
MKKMMAANWKMHKTRAEARESAATLIASLAAIPADREVVIFAPYTVLADCAKEFEGKTGFSLGGQNVYSEDHGAFTGEISPAMLRDAGCTHVLTGHSERRALFHESSEFIGKKTAFALKQGLKVTLCIGETLEQREAGKLESVLREQLTKGLAEVDNAVSENDLAIAYEPVWAIGTGKVAGPAEILETHALVRKLLVERFPKQGTSIRILYGGSVKPDNTPEIITLDNVDGVLVGGASLDAASMRRIVLA